MCPPPPNPLSGRSIHAARRVRTYVCMYICMQEQPLSLRFISFRSFRVPFLWPFASLFRPFLLLLSAESFARRSSIFRAGGFCTHAHVTWVYFAQTAIWFGNISVDDRVGIDFDIRLSTQLVTFYNLKSADIFEYWSRSSVISQIPIQINDGSKFSRCKSSLKKKKKKEKNKSWSESSLLKLTAPTAFKEPSLQPSAQKLS